MFQWKLYRGWKAAFPALKDFVVQSLMQNASSAMVQSGRSNRMIADRNCWFLPVFECFKENSDRSAIPVPAQSFFVSS
jgi:hypothetical protein